jgi:hypothetical protein
LSVEVPGKKGIQLCPFHTSRAEHRSRRPLICDTDKWSVLDCSPGSIPRSVGNPFVRCGIVSCSGCKVSWMEFSGLSANEKNRCWFSAIVMSWQNQETKVPNIDPGIPSTVLWKWGLMRISTGSLRPLSGISVWM